MVQKDSCCSWCGTSVSETDDKCPTCGKVITRKVVAKKLERKDYSGVYQQQGRVATDADWNETIRTTTRRDLPMSLRCPSCGAVHKANVRRCSKCGASF